MQRPFKKPNLSRRQKVEQMLNHPGTPEAEKENCRRVLKNMKPEVADILYDDRIPRYSFGKKYFMVPCRRCKVYCDASTMNDAMCRGCNDEMDGIRKRYDISEDPTWMDEQSKFYSDLAEEVFFLNRRCPVCGLGFKVELYACSSCMNKKTKLSEAIDDILKEK